jgi:hypothetical protein
MESSANSKERISGDGKRAIQKFQMAPGNWRGSQKPYYQKPGILPMPNF